MTRREDVILSTMEKMEFFSSRCIHHAGAIGDDALTTELNALAHQVERVKRAARETLEKANGGTPLTPGWTLDAGSGAGQ